MEDFFSTTEMREVFSATAHVQAMLDFEAALVWSEAALGIIPETAAENIATKCRVELFDVAALYREAALAGTPAIPLVRMLTALVEGEAKKYVHWGATSQDAIDTALMLQMRAGLDLLLAELDEIAASCATLAEQHRNTLMVGRTLLQQALPITFGLKAARWLSSITGQIEILRQHRAQTLAVQFGGAAGTLASLGERGPEVVEKVAAELQLVAPELPWHTERDRVARVTGSLGVVAGTLAKIGTDLALLAQTEIGEASEGAAPGKGGSSAMPQKRNPVDTTAALAAARLAIGIVPVILGAMSQEHERAVGGWQTEWVALPDLFRYTSGAVEGIRAAVANLEVNAEKMRQNLDLTNGLVMAESLTTVLAVKVGRAEAYKIVQNAVKKASAEGQELRQIVLDDPQAREHLTPAAIDRALDPAQYLGSTQVFIDRALSAYRRLQTPAGD